MFDWGNTLMRVFPQYSGPMASWPQVETLPGAAQALKDLAPAYNLAVATNASDSDAENVRAALRRGGLDEFIQHVFTAQELGRARKPDISFYRTVETALDVRSESLVMVGDTLRTDIIGAVAAGWRAVWFNPDALPATGLLPLHDAEVMELGELPRVLQSLTLPGWSTCIDWLAAQGATHYLLQHVQLVAAVAYQLAQWLRASGVSVDPLLAHRGGLLHDLMKPHELKESGRHRDHGVLAAENLAARGQPALGEIARRHPLFCIFTDDRRPVTWEQKLVYFADKLVEHGQISPLEIRVQALRLRYPQDADRIQACAPEVYALQDEICSLLQFSPDDLIQRLQAAAYRA